jgi:uncharacterized membrane protein (DUF4010 family)
MPIPFDTNLAWSLLAALLTGALVGIEREKSKAASGNVGIGGVRTFTLFALVGALGALLAQVLGGALVLVAVVLAVSALLIAGYVIQSQSRPDAIGLTTETAGLAVCLLGAACTSGHREAALACAIVVSAFLAYKEPLHGLVAKLAPDDISAGIKLLAASFIVLPLLPNTPIDPWGALKPRSLWMLVILMAALSLVGYVATRALGPERGTAITGLTGGLVSSTAVTLSFARRSREEGGAGDAVLAAGTFLAWCVSFLRILVLAALVHPPLVPSLAVPIGVMLLVTAGVAGALLRGRRSSAPDASGPGLRLRNPFSLLQAAKFAALFAVVLLVLAIVQQYFPHGGTYVVAALAGTTDVDAITLGSASLARSGDATVEVAAGSIVVAALTNTIVKCGVSAGLGGPLLRRAALALTAVLVAIGLAALALA